MKRILSIFLAVAMLLMFAACGKTESSEAPNVEPSTATDIVPIKEDVTIELSDNEILINGNPADSNSSKAVYVANDIVYYEAGHDFTYGEGEKADEHSAGEAAAHTVVHISKAGTYRISGVLSTGQIAVDLGKDAKKDPTAVVTLVLDGVDITCTVAPAVIFYNVYECGDKDDPTKDVDTSAAGANVILAAGSENTVNGSYVARIYKPDSVVLSADGKSVEEAKKLHKYDAAFYSKMSMNVSGETEYGGTLVIKAENEGLDSEMHLTINSGTIAIASGNDGINTNEDGVSVTTVNGGLLRIKVTGETGEGDGIDSNGWLVINGGVVVAAAYGSSMDSGVDSDMGIHVNGGELIATGNMLDRIENGGQTNAVFTFNERQKGGTNFVLKDSKGTNVLSVSPENDFSILVFSSPSLTEGEYTLWQGDTQLMNAAISFGGGGFGGGMMPRPEMGRMPEGFDPNNMPQSFDPNNMPPQFNPQNMPHMPEGVTSGPNMPMPDNFDPNNVKPPVEGGKPNMDPSQLSEIFTIVSGSNNFTVVYPN